MSETGAYQRLLEVIARLRGPEGCPWDREQTHQSLRPYLLEEAHEALEAIDRQQWQELCQELGDVLLQVVLHAAIAAEAGHFAMEDVCQGLIDKLVFRHPHVFGQAEAADAEAVVVRWEELKRQERGARGAGDDRKSALDGLPAGLPALLRAQRVQGRAARVGFDWSDVTGPLAKVEEEFAELREAWQEGNGEATEDELGDLLFALVNTSRFLHVDAESALRRATAKFERRFRAVEEAFARRGQDLTAATLAEMDAVWEQVKEDLGTP